MVWQPTGISGITLVAISIPTLQTRDILRKLRIHRSSLQTRNNLLVTFEKICKMVAILPLEHYLRRGLNGKFKLSEAPMPCLLVKLTSSNRCNSKLISYFSCFFASCTFEKQEFSSISYVNNNA